MRHVILLSIFILQLRDSHNAIFIIGTFILMTNLCPCIVISFIIVNYIIVDIFYAFSTLLIDDLNVAFNINDIFMLINVFVPIII